MSKSLSSMACPSGRAQFLRLCAGLGEADSRGFCQCCSRCHHHHRLYEASRSGNTVCLSFRDWREYRDGNTGEVWCRGVGRSRRANRMCYRADLHLQQAENRAVDGGRNCVSIIRRLLGVCAGLVVPHASCRSGFTITFAGGQEVLHSQLNVGS